MLILLSETIITPLGELEIITDEQGNLRALEWVEFRDRLMKLLISHYGQSLNHKNSNAAVLPKSKKTKVGFLLTQHSVAKDLRQRIEDYFAGNLHSIDNIVVATLGTEFQNKVWTMLRTIPCGQVISYGEMAKRLGKPKAARAVGMANASNLISLVVPCHRVIGSNGTLTGYASGIERKRWLLIHEGYLNL